MRIVACLIYTLGVERKVLPRMLGRKMGANIAPRVKNTATRMPSVLRGQTQCYRLKSEQFQLMVIVPGGPQVREWMFVFNLINLGNVIDFHADSRILVLNVKGIIQ